ncbi:MAG: sigma-54 dependent transcriptional regulator [Alphaproteobacteria bacterium]
MGRHSVLIVEDSPSLAYTYAEYLRGGKYDVSVVETGQAALDHMAAHLPDAIFLDLGLPDMNGMDILKHIAENKIPTVVIVITAQGSVSVAVEAMRAGAHDFLVKPFAADRLRVTLTNALEREKLKEIVTTYREQIDRRGHHGFVGSSLAMQAVYRIIDAAAQTKASVFITGESGTGKEVCAEAIHRQSPRRDKPFVALNCAAIPKDLIESEIFGHMKGAFTGATADREGAAAMARGGTLFLDEIAEMDVGLQSKLLRLIQSATFQRVGSSRTEEADVHFIAATNRDPLAEVTAGRFREDLYYRLHVIPIHLPPLREREADVIELAEFFLLRFAKEEGKRFRTLSADVRDMLFAYPWPGNVRQLQNVVRNVVVLHDGEEVQPGMLPPPLATRSPSSGPRPVETSESSPPPPSPGTSSNVLRPLWLQEKEIIEKAIALCDGNIPRAAASLEVSPSTLYRKKQAWEQGAPPSP